MKIYLKKLLNFLTRTDTPLWVTFVGFLFGAVSVYYLTPLLNQQLEKQKIKTEYVIRSLDSISNKTQEMFAEITIANRKIAAEADGYSENLDKAVRLATELQWKSIEISAVLDDEESSIVIDRFQTTLGEARDQISKVKSAETALAALTSIRKFIPASYDLTNRIAKLSGIKFRA